MEKLDICGRVVGPGEPPYFIAEIGSNHNGDMDMARKLIRAAVEVGADAVKFQSWSSTSLISREEYERNTSYSDPHRHFGSLQQMVEKYQLTPSQHEELAAYCREQGAVFLSTPFSRTEVDLLDGLGVPAFKVASMDINNLDLLSYIGEIGKPVILSTGMANLGEIERALATLNGAGSGPVCLLHCVAVYPPSLTDLNLLNINMLRQTFDVPTGFSDHTRGTVIPHAAVALGACLIEKHFTLDHSMPGWDHEISADPAEMLAVVNGGRDIYMALGSAKRSVNADEQAKRLSFRRSAVAARELPAGHTLTDDDLEYKRPGTGISPDQNGFILGRTLRRDLRKDQVLQWEDFI